MAEPTNASYVGLRMEISSKVPWNAQSILDIGAADGTLGAHLLAQSSNDRRVTGIEADPALAKIAECRLTTVLCTDVETLDWSTVNPGETFDCIVLADVLEHLRDPDRTLQQAVARLARDGTVVICLPNIRHISAAWSIYGVGTFPRRDRGLFDATHLRWFTPRDAVRLCDRAGLNVTQVEHRLRLRDRPGGALNELVERLPWLSRVPVAKDLLSYQIVLVAHHGHRMS